MLALAKCAYDACQLPDNNNRFILQGVYILIGIFVLLSDSKNFIIEYSEICIMTVDLLEKCVRRVGSLAGHTFYECLHAGAVKIVSDK